MIPADPSNFEDRISEVYYGSLSSERLTRRARDRIHWMCKSVIGERVLDVGCSQGIASILLGREGYSVVGIDTNSAAIEFANNDLAKEADEVRARVTFLEADLFSFEDAANFDTVILGEIIEHMMDPQACIEKALIPLRLDGRIVATTPFGHAPHDDHKSTMFLSWLFQLSDLSIRVDTCEIVDGYIQLIITKLPDDQPSSFPSLRKLLRTTESGTLNSQRRLHAMIDQRQKEIERLEQLQNAADAIRSDEMALLRLRNELGDISDLMRRYDHFSEAATHLRAQVDELRHTADELQRFRNLDQLEADLSAAKAKESSLTILSNKMKSAMREAESSQREVAELRNSVSYAVGSEIVTAFRRPSRLLLLPALMLRAVRRVLAARQAPPAEVCQRLTKSASVIIVDPKGVTLEQETIPDQAYQVSIDVVGETDPCRKGILLEVLLDASELEDFLRRNAHFRKRSATDTAFMYLDLNGAAAQKISTVVWTGMKSKITRLSLSRFRGTDPIALIFNALRPIGRAEALANKVSANSPEPTNRAAARNPMEVLSILDPFTESCLEPEVELIPVSKTQWRQEIDNSNSKLLFVESAWRGNGGEWNYALNKPEKHGGELKDLIAYCSSKGIPTLFWNKEDPANFDTFIDAAAWFDFVFTTDAGSVENYRKIIGKDNVFVLPFAAQPSMHNPVRHGEMIPRIAFTGSWRGKKYPARAQWIETLLDPLAEADMLDIFDRFAGTTDNPDLIFPQSLQPAIKGGLPYRDLVEQVYKRYAAFANVNSVDTSETMLARRVFEILACGAPVISSPSPAMERIFGDIVLTPSSKKEALETGRRLLNDLVFREDLASRGVRLVHSRHTYAHRMAEVCERAGLPYIARKPKLVSAICVSHRPEFLEHVHAQLARQNHDHIELIFVQNSAAFSEEEIAARFSAFKLKLLSIPEEQFLADGLNAALKVASGDYVAKIDDDDFYGANYLSDSLLAFEYAPTAGLVGKKSFFAYVEDVDQTVLRFPNQSYRFCRHVHGGTLVWDRRRLEGVEFEPVQRGTDTRFLDEVRHRGVKIFSADPFNFVHVRYADKTRHTWKIDDEEFISKAIKVGSGLREELVLN
jgi:spore maturation protein CgeB/SAM-dependent methyltransferase